MKSLNLLVLLSIALTWIISAVKAVGMEDYYYVNFNLPMNIADENDPEYNRFVENVIDEIYETINRNKDSYLHPENISKENIVYVGSQKLLVYLSPITVDSVLSLTHLVNSIEPKSPFVLGNDLSTSNEELPYNQGFYVVTAENPFGKLNKEDDEQNEYLDSIVYDISCIIRDNVNTFEDSYYVKDALYNISRTHIEGELGDGIAFYVSNTEDRIYFFVYLNTKLISKVRALSHINFVGELAESTKSEENPSVESEENLKNEKNYGAMEDYYYVKFKLPVNIADENDPEYNGFVEDVIDYVHETINRNKDSYVHPENINKENIIYVGSQKLLVYLSPITVDSILSLTHLIASIEPKTPFVLGTDLRNSNEDLPYNQGFYVVTAENPFGKLNREELSYEQNEYIDKLIYDISCIIRDNVDTFEDSYYVKDILFNISRSHVEKVLGEGITIYVYDTEDRIYFFVYLNTKLISQVSALPHVNFIGELAKEGEEVKEKEEEEKPIVDKCKTTVPGYSCCSPDNTRVIAHDKDGNWGYDFEKKEWCIIPENSNPECFSLSLGYPCCKECGPIYSVNSDGSWGYENKKWCGIKNECQI